MKKLKISIPLLLILALLINTTTLLSPVAAQWGYIGLWSPDLGWYANIIDQDWGEPGCSFDIWVIIEYVEDLYGYEFKLRYDPATLNATALTFVDDTAGGVFPPVTEDPDTSTKIWKQEIYRDVGYVWFAASLPPGSDYGIPYANGILATVSFSVLDRGGSILDLDDTILGNSPPNGGINMEHEVLDGVFSNAGIPPVAGFVASKYEAYGEEPITFDAIGPDPNNPLSYDPDGTIVSYHWDFGDGTSLTTTTPYAEYSYALLGVFTVGLTVTDNRGVEDYYETSIIVYAPTTLKADLTEWKAKPRYKVLDISRRETTVNTFFADVANLCNITDSVKVKVTFTVLDADAKLVRIVETNEYTFGPNTYLATTDDWAIQYGWHGLNTTAEATGLPAQFDAAGLTLGRFYVTAKASYKLPGDIDWTPGTAKKAFSFVVKP